MSSYDYNFIYLINNEATLTAKFVYIFEPPTEECRAQLEVSVGVCFFLFLVVLSV